MKKGRLLRQAVPWPPSLELRPVGHPEINGLSRMRPLRMTFGGASKWSSNPFCFLFVIQYAFFNF